MRYALVGCGWAGELRAQALGRLAGASLVAVTDVDASRAAALAKAHGAAVEPSWSRLVSRDDVEAVIVSTPPNTHAEVCVAALERSRHVLCEKPLARNPEECERLVAVADRAGVLLATGFNYRFYPAIRKARELLDSGRIGDLDHVRGYAGHPGGDEFTHSWVHDPEVMGGGALLDNGIHLVDLTRYFLGEVAEVKGYASGNVWGFPGCEDNGFALLRSPEGKVGTLQASWSEWRGYRFHVEIFGTRGCIRASYPPMATRVAWRPQEGGSLRRKTFLFPVFQILERIRSHRWTMLGSFQNELRAFEQASRGGAAPVARGRDGLRAVQIAHAVYRSTAGGQAVRLDA